MVRWVSCIILGCLLLPSARLFAAKEEQQVSTVFSSGSEAELIEPVAPVYPKFALQRRIEGWVVLSFRINESGEPENVPSSIS